MKHKIVKSLLTAALIVTSAWMIGCASMGAKNTEDLLSSAGFETRVPTTPEQIGIFEDMANYKMKLISIEGYPVYVYKDPRQGVLYVGGDDAYQRFKQLGLEQQIAQEDLMAAELDEEASLDYAVWGDDLYWWDY